MGKVVLILSALLCAYLGSSYAFEDFAADNEYHYNFESSVKSVNADKPEDFLLSGKVIITNFGRSNDVDFIGLELSKVSLQTLNKKIPDSKTIGGKLFIEKDSKSGLVKNIFKESYERSILAINLLKSIGSLLQFSPVDVTRTETDISGECEVQYKSQNNEIIKIKSKCIESEEIISDEEDPLSMKLDHDNKVTYTFFDDNSEIKSIDNSESVTINLVGNPEIGTKFSSKIFLKFESKKPLKEPKIKEKILKEHKATLGDWSKRIFQRCSDDSCASLNDFISFKKDDFDKIGLGGHELAMATLTTIFNMKSVTNPDLLKILNSKKVKPIKGQILDVLAGKPTWDSYSAVMKVLDISKETDFPDLERYLQSLMVSPKVENKIIDDLISRLESDKFTNQKLTSTIIQTVSSLCQTSYMTKTPFKGCDSLGELLWDKYSSLKELSEKSIILRGFINLRCPNEMKNLLNIVETEPKTLAYVAMQALLKMKSSQFDGGFRKKLIGIICQSVKKYDSSIRTMALEIILRDLRSTEELQTLLNLLKSKDKSFEVNRYLIESLNSKAENCNSFKDMLMSALKSDPRLNNYNILAPGGLSTILTRQFTRNPSLNSSILSIQEIEKGVLKRGIVDLLFHSKTNKMSYFTLELYARGLAALAGSKDEEENEEDADVATAGMEISVNGNLMRQLEFFSGQGELMGHVWSGTASDRTPAYQATTILRNIDHHILLQSGFIFELNFLVGISVDLTGQISISLWNRNAKSNVEQNIGLAILGRASLQSDFGTSRTEFHLVQEPQLSLKSHIEFSGNNLLCLELNQPDSLVTHTTIKTMNIPSISLNKEKKSDSKFILPGNSHMLNQKNNEMCNLIHNS